MIASPMWLLGLVPWAAVAAYALRTGGAVRAIPFVDLWRDAATGPPAADRTRWRLSGGVLWALAAAAAGIAAAAGLTRGTPPGDVATVVFDRSVRREWPGGDGVVDGAVDRVRRLVGRRAVVLVPVPAWAATGDGWAAQARDAPPAAVETGVAVDAAVARALRGGGRGPVVVVTGHEPLADDPRVIRVAPPAGAGGVGIHALALRVGPVPQVMVRVVNRSDRRTGTVRVTSGSVDVTRPVPLPGSGAVADLFVDLPGRLADTVGVTLDATQVDGRAWLTADRTNAAATAAVALPEPVRRVVRVINRAEGAAETGGAIVTGDPLAADQAGVCVVPGLADAGGGETVVTAHPVTADVVHWTGGGAPVPAGMTVLARVGGRPVVAVRDGPARQVWVDPDVAEWSRTADWVVFFDNALQWVGGGRAAYAASGPRTLGAGWDLVEGGPAPAGVAAGWWPGVYQSADGRRTAVDAGRAAGPLPPAAEPVAPAGVSLGPAGGVAAVGCLLAAAMAWPRGERRRGS